MDWAWFWFIFALMAIGLDDFILDLIRALRGVGKEQMEQLAAENDKLRAENMALKKILGPELQARVETLEDIVTDEEYELNRKIGKLK
jgi:regulator of replication initiation timing